jgi:pyruvate formate lyase activating enzyme
MMSGMAANASVTGMVFNVQRYSLHDGPGIRTTVFLKGCPLRCPWCHNPESLAAGPEVALREARCLGCESCVEACPLEDGPLPAGAELGSGDCLACRRCVEACPAGAREIAGREWSADEVVAEVLRDRLFYDDSGGGATFSGGEPLAQPEFLCACLAGCRRAGVHTALDTAGFATREVVLAAAGLSDLVLWDLKLMEPEAHQRLVGAPLEPILDNLRAVAAAHPRVWLRVPVIPGLTDQPANLAAMAELAATLPAVERLCLLPYHPLGTGKLGRLGRNAPEVLETPGETRMEELAAALRPSGVEIQIGG